MFWFQGLVSFALWIGYGVFQSRRSEKIRVKLTAIPRGKRGLMGAITMILGASALFGTLLGTYALGGFGLNGMTILAWIAISIGGLFFVHSQTMSMAILVTLMAEPGVTSMGSKPSDPQGPDIAQP